jgi:hypothetical protein
VDCLVKSNCNHRWECDFCEYYSDYQPEDKRILSPRQLDKKQKKSNKDPEAVKRGKRNKSTGYRSEKYMLDKYIKWGIKAEKQPGSGKFKGSLGSDIKVTLLGKERLHEDKTRSNAGGKFKKVKDTAIMYEDFCVLMNELDFEILVREGKLPNYNLLPDKNTKGIHDFFNQDNADIVSIRLPKNRECIYAVRLGLWREYSVLSDKPQE